MKLCFYVQESFSYPQDQTEMTSAQFECQYCTVSLLGKKYVLKDDNLYCVSCYDRIFSNYCEHCKEPIESDSKVGITSVDSYCL